MPSTYAHYRFGQQVLSSLPKEMKEDIEPYYKLFDIGLHGPDILFYYNPLSSNTVNQKGFSMHEEAAIKFFQKAGEVLLHKENRIPYLAYIYGFICHFVLDSQCHGYIDEKIAESGISHTEIEVEFDRRLMVEDGYNPLTQSLTEHIYPTNFNASIIKSFFEGVTKEEIQTSLKSMKWYNKLVLAPFPAKRWFVYALLKISGNYKEMHGLIVNYKANPKCMDSNDKLNAMYENALKQAAVLICEYEDCVDYKKSYHSRYQLTFGSKEPEMDPMNDTVEANN